MCDMYAQPPFLTMPLAMGRAVDGNVFFGASNGGSMPNPIGNLVGQPFVVNGLNRITNDAGQFDNGRCQVGAKNMDGQCTCPGSGDSAPWQPTPVALSRALFIENTQNYSGDPNVPDGAARYLTTIHGRYGSAPCGATQNSRY